MEPNWLRPETRLERFEDSEIDGRPCFVVRCWSSSDEDNQVDLWIDKENSIVWQAAFPSTCLAEKVRRSPEITELRIIARFHEASFEKKLTAENFALKSRTDATPVSKFVKIPEALPSELIGFQAPEFSLLTQSGKELRTEHFRDKTTTLMWIADNVDLDTIYEFDKLAKSLPGERQNYGVVYSEPHRASYDTDIHAMNMALNEVARNTQMPFYYDQDLATSMLFRLKSIPCLVVLDKNSKVQFACTIQGEWLNDIKVAIERITAGEDIANEMLDDYEQFLDAYHQQLLAFKATDEIGSLARGQDDADSVLNPTGRLSATRTWTNSQFRLPGNICISATPESVKTFVFDGWRTVVQLDADGRTVERHELEMPNDVGVSVLRTNTDKNGQGWFAAFMPEDKRVFVFNQDWKPVFTYPNQGQTAIRDVQFIADQRLLVAFADDDGLRAVNIATGQDDVMSEQELTSVSGQNPLAVKDAQLFDYSSNRPVSSTKDWKIGRIVASPNGSCCLGTSRDGNWFAIGVSDNSEIAWTASIGPQDFENNIQPVSVSESGTARWAIANSKGTIHLFGLDGSWLGDCKLGEQIMGFALVATSDGQRLLVATASGVTNWNLSFPQPATMPASHQNSR